MRRIECENKGCTQTLNEDDLVCAQCGHQQTSAGWAAVLLLLYYPLISLLVGFGLLAVVGLLLAGSLSAQLLFGVVAGAMGVYAWLASSVILRYFKRKRRLKQAPEIEGYR